MNHTRHDQTQPDMATAHARATIDEKACRKTAFQMGQKPCKGGWEGKGECKGGGKGGKTVRDKGLTCKGEGAADIHAPSLHVHGHQL